jgi:hypothetical protein
LKLKRFDDELEIRSGMIFGEVRIVSVLCLSQRSGENLKDGTAVLRNGRSAARVRRLAQEATTPAPRDNLADVALQYEKLAEGAEAGYYDPE